MSGDYGISALAGILGGLAGLPAGMVQREKLDQSQEHLNLLQQQMGQQQAQFDASKFLNVPASSVPSTWGGAADATGIVKVPTAAFPTINQQRTQELQQEALTKRNAALGLALGPMAANDPQMKALMDALSTGAMDPDKTVQLFETLRQHRGAEADRASNLNILSKLTGIDLGQPATGLASPQPPPLPAPRITPTGGAETPLPLTGPIPPVTPASQYPEVQQTGRDLNAAISNLAMTANQLPGTAAAPQAPAGLAGRPGYKQPKISFSPKTGVSVEFAPETPPTDDKDSWASALYGQGVRFAQLPAPQQQEVLRRIGDERVRISAAQGENAAKIPQRTPEAQIKDFSNIDLAQGQLNEMLRLAPKVQLPQIAGGLAPWVNAIAQTGKVGPIPIPKEISGQLSDDQNRFLALLQDYADQVLRLRSGAQINEQEFKRMLGFLASPDVTPQVIMQRLALQQDFLKAKRRSMETTLQGAGYRYPEAQVPSMAPPAGAPPPMQVPDVAPQSAPQPSLLQRALPFLFGGGQQGKVRVQSPDGRTGTWDLSKGPIPQGYKRLE